jgi:hypothetical protein
VRARAGAARFDLPRYAWDDLHAAERCARGVTLRRRVLPRFTKNTVPLVTVFASIEP